MQKLMNWDFARVKERLINKDELAPTYVNLLEQEYKRYVAIVLLNPDTPIPICHAVDVFWHAHIIFTHDYVKFGNELNGKYLHHAPTVTEAEEAALLDAYIHNTLASYDRLFGPHDPLIWAPRACCGCMKTACG